MNRRTFTIAAALAATIALPAAAAAHVTLQPAQAPAGGFARLDVRVLNEDPSKATTKVEVQMPRASPRRPTSRCPAGASPSPSAGSRRP